MTFDLVSYIAVCTLITYGMTASALMLPLRLRIAVRSPWLQTLVYCPVCFGFWVAEACAVMYPTEIYWHRFVFGPALFILFVLLVKSYHKLFLVSESWREEEEMIAEATRPRRELDLQIGLPHTNGMAPFDLDSPEDHAEGQSRD